MEAQIKALAGSIVSGFGIGIGLACAVVVLRAAFDFHFC